MKEVTRKHLEDINYLKVTKVAIGSTTAILSANAMGLKYSASAGIIALLTITDTKKDTISLAKNRIIAYLISTVIAYVVFETLGYSTLVFGIYMLLFMSCCCVLKYTNVISICAVQTTHYLAEHHIGFSMLMNETAVFMIGAGIGVLLNLYMPDYTNILMEDIKKLEDEVRVIYGSFAKRLEHKDDNTINLEVNKLLLRLKKDIKEALSHAYTDSDNSLRVNRRYYIEYLVMRKHQTRKLEQVNQLIERLTYLPPQSQKLSRLCIEIQDTYEESNSGTHLLTSVNKLRKEYQEEEIPMTREEFENRAILFQILQEVEEFLMIKLEFTNQCAQTQVELEWQRE